MLPMIQAQFSLEKSQLRFLEQCKEYGFKDKSEAVRTAIEHLCRELERHRPRESARLYAQVYDEDREIRELTESAILDWPS